jgi:hypothetical protein
VEKVEGRTGESASSGDLDAESRGTDAAAPNGWVVVGSLPLDGGAGQPSWASCGAADDGAGDQSLADGIEDVGLS